MEDLPDDEKLLGKIIETDKSKIAGQKRKYVFLQPVQGPINAPYKKFMEKRDDLNN